MQCYKTGVSPMYDLKTTLPTLLTRVGDRCAQLFFARDLERHDVTLPMYQVLATLARHDDQRLGDLAVLAELEVSTLSRLIGAMQRRRLVSRRRSGKDARAVRIRITDHGRVLASKLMAAASTFEGAVTRDLSQRQVQELRRTLAQLVDTVAALEADPPAEGAKGRAQRRSSAA